MEPDADPPPTPPPPPAVKPVAEQLAEAEAAYHDLQTGKAVVEVQDSNGDRVRYTQANVGRLAAYIAELTRRVAGAARPTTIHFRTSKGI